MPHSDYGVQIPHQALHVSTLYAPIQAVRNAGNLACQEKLEGPGTIPVSFIDSSTIATLTEGLTLTHC